MVTSWGVLIGGLLVLNVLFLLVFLAVIAAVFTWWVQTFHKLLKEWWVP